jgi:hypothetical protein
MGSPHFVTACWMRASMKMRNIPWLYASPEYLRPCWRSSTRLFSPNNSPPYFDPGVTYPGRFSWAGQGNRRCIAGRIDLRQCRPADLLPKCPGQWQGSLTMKKSAFCLMLAGATLPSAARAQVSVDMDRVTCADYLALSAADSAVFSAWMSGWFNQKTGYVFVDLNAYVRNVANVKAWCASNPTQTVMAGLQRATAR